MHQVNDLVRRLASEIRGQQTELKIMADKMQLERKTTLDLLADLATIAKNDPKSLMAELEEWRTTMAEWEWITCVNDRSHEIGTLIDMVNARNGR
ncbi:hypothetical protein CSPAE12_06622 [Colletotrichum incanum]|nr:hypothetical protein CSPAE12_06622 [Colletotrichum incanum]